MARSDTRREPYVDDAPPPRAGGDETRARRRSGSLMGRFLYWSLVLGLWGAIGLGGLVAYYVGRLPPIDQLAIPKRPPNIAILSVDGELLANRGDTGGAAVSLKELPPYLPKALIAVEDRRFYAHWGVDPLGVLRALSRDALGRGGVQGGSTLTQQLAKNLFLTQERTISRKIQEAILALWLEHKYTKDQILELYLNRVYFGSGAYGVEAAARRYYGHGARDLTLAEAATLAGLVKAPSRLAPDRNPKGAHERAAQVLAAMETEGFVSPGLEAAALANPARTRRDNGAGSVNYAADYVMDALHDRLAAIDEDIVVQTTLSRPLQNAAERALTEELDRKGGKYGVEQGALIALDGAGAIRALVGGRDYGDSQFNRAVTAKRQPGSAFKPFVYLTALEQGLTPDTMRQDAPLEVKGWRPENYSHEYFGPVTLTKALALSLNTVAVRVGLEVGPAAVARTAHRLGISSELQPNASLALGTSEVSPLELVSAYAPFSNGGIGVQPHVILKVRTTGGKLLYAFKGGSNGRVIEPQYVAMMDAMMQETLLTGTARKAELPGWQAAGKTGTSQEFRDAWFIGFTSRLVAGVWLGNDDNSPTKKVSGGNLPVEVWSRFMKAAHQGVAPAPLPGGDWRREEAPAPQRLAEGLLGLFGGGRPPTPPPRPEPPPRPRVVSAPPAAGPAPLHGLETLIPPEDIPTGEARSAERRPPPREKNIFEKLFGG
jgi:penicillin-binding protein 1A